MTPDEKASFRLSPGLGSPSRTIYQRILKKIYGTERGLEIIELLHNNPAQTVPIVLKRLKQKDDEWKRAQREWNKIWREVEAKNYWKSLDYQGITFKMTDRKAMTTRSLVSQAEAMRTNEHLNLVMNQFESSKPQFNFSFKDISVFKDVSRLIYFFLERQPVYNLEDCESMRIFMNQMIPMFFDVEDVEPSTIETTGDIIMEEVVEGDEDDKSIQSIDSIDTSSKKDTVARSNRRPRRGQLQDDDGLLKDVLTRNMNKKVRGNSSSDDDEDDDDEDEDDEHEDEDHEEIVSRHIHDEEDDEDEDDEDEDEDEDEDDDGPRRRRPHYNQRTNRRSSKPKRSVPQPKKKTITTPPKIATVASLIEKETSVEPENQKTYNFFGDNGFYCFFRLYQVLYDRLCKMKALDTEFRKHPEKSEKACEEAHDLGITPRRFKGKLDHLQWNKKRSTRFLS